MNFFSKIKLSKIKYILTPALGFGLAGVVWGWSLYTRIPEINYPLTILGAIFLGIFGGLGLSIWSKNIKQILKTCILGLLGSIIGFFIAFLGIYHVANWGTFIIGLLFNLILLPISLSKFVSGLEPSLIILAYWLNFILAGLFVGLFFALALKTKLWPMIWRGGIGFGLGAIVSPIIGNLLGNLFNSILISYITTFALINVILGLFLVLGIKRNS